MALPGQLSYFNYRPVYQGIPLEEAEKAMQMGAQSYDTNLEEYNKAEALLASVKALPQDQQYLKEKGKEVAGAISKITDQVSGTQRWDLAKDAVRRVKSSVNADAKLKAINESYANFNEGEKMKQEIRAKGGVPFEISDISTHKSFDDQGNINIYQPDIQVKADYVKTAQNLWDDVAPDIAAANLVPSEIEGILSGQTIKGISPEKLKSKLSAVELAYNQTAEGQQHKLFIQKNSPKENPDKFINQFLFGVGSLRTFREEHNERMPDPSYEWRMRAQIAEQNNAAKLAIKMATGRGNHDPDADKYLGVESITTKGNVGDKKIQANGLMIRNPKMIEGLSDSAFVNDVTTLVPLDSNQKIDIKGDSVKNVKIKGFALDDFHGADSVGGMFAEATIVDDAGKEKKMNVLIKNTDPAFRAKFKTFQTISETLKKNKEGHNNNGKGYVVDDTSGLLNFGQDVDVKFRVRADNRIFPVLPKKDGGYRPPTPEESKYLMLKDHYDMSDLQGLLKDKIVPGLKVYTETASQINE